MIRAALAFLIVLSSARGEASPTRAAELADAANALAAKGQFMEAAVKFAEAAREDPSNPNLFCNIGIVYFKAEQWARAHLLLKLCVDRTGLQQKTLDSAGPVIASIEDTMRAGGHAQVGVGVTPKTTSLHVAEWGPETTFISERVVWLPLGTYRLVARADGYADQTITVKVETTAKQDITIEMKRPSSVVVEPLPPDKQPVPAATSKPSIVPPLLTTGLAVAAGIFMVISNGKANDEAENARLVLTREEFDDTVGEVDQWNTLTAVSGATLIVATGLTAYLWLRVFRHREAPVGIAPTAGGAAATFTHRF